MGLGRLLRKLLTMKGLRKMWKLLTMKGLKTTTARVLVAVVGSGVAAGIALTVGVAEGSNRAATTTRATQRQAAPSVAETVPTGLAASYRVLTSSSSATLPTSLTSDLGWTGSYGANPSLGREAGSIATEHLWLVPGDSGSCLEVDSGYSACGSNALVEQQGIWLILKPVSGAAPTMYGVVPDGATVSGDSASARVSQSGNAVMVTPNSSTAGRFTIHTASGTTVDMTVPAATGHPQ